jgi:hypothetical protein
MNFKTLNKETKTFDELPPIGEEVFLILEADPRKGGTTYKSEIGKYLGVTGSTSMMPTPPECDEEWVILTNVSFFDDECNHVRVVGWEYINKKYKKMIEYNSKTREFEFLPEDYEIVNVLVKTESGDVRLTKGYYRGHKLYDIPRWYLEDAHEDDDVVVGWVYIV